MQNMEQLGLFDQKSYAIPGLVEGQEVMVYDADDWERFNGACGTIVSAPIPYRGYDVKLDDGRTYHFYEREIMKR